MSALQLCPEFTSRELIRALGIILGVGTWLGAHNCDSCQHTDKCHVHGGQVAIRRVLYMRLWSVIRKQDDIKLRYQRQRAIGSAANVASHPSHADETARSCKHHPHPALRLKARAKAR